MRGQRPVLLVAAAAVFGLIAAWSLLVFAYALVHVVVLGHGHSGARHGSGALAILLVLLAANAGLFGFACVVIARRARGAAM